jgi:NAD-dependent dihydropyrimidine dehydrogenase PreA subunit
MRPYYLKNVTTLAYDESKCTGCGRCVQVCPQQVFDLQNGKARLIDRDRCMECGACAGNCPVAALEVDAGVGCAAAILMGMLTGNEPSCG